MDFDIKFFLKRFHRGIRKKYWVRSKIFMYGLPEDFLVNGKKANGDIHKLMKT